MGKYLKKFKKGIVKVDQKIKELSSNTPDLDLDFPDDDLDKDNADNYDLGFDNYDDVGIQPSQKPESFHHFILENQYKDLERSIRGFKDVYDKNKSEWITKRKEQHCFTDEEAEEILRTAQSHLATDVKLGYVSKEAFPLLMDAVYKELAFLFESIAEYRYGRYNSKKDGKIIINYELQYQMKLQNHKIFLELFTRVQANYSRSIQGQENKYTHESVKGQESLQQTEQGLERRQRYM